MKKVLNEDTFELYPRGDNGPVFEFRYLCQRRYFQAMACYEAVRNAVDDEVVAVGLAKMLQIGLAGWRGVTSNDPEVCSAFKVNPGDVLPFNADLIDMVARREDIIAMASPFAESQILGSAERGNSSLPARSPQAQSVATASMDNAATSAKDSSMSISPKSPVPSAAASPRPATPAPSAPAVAAG